VQERATVVFEEDRIVGAGPGVAPPPAAEIRDVSGCFVMPGLIDMHVHVLLCGADSLLAFLGAGVTTVRDLGSDPARSLPMRAELAAGKRDGPRLYVYGPMLDGEPPIFGEGARASRLTRVIANEAEGAQVIEELLAAGVDGIKLYAGLRPDLLAAMTRSVARRVPVAAHLGRTWASEAIAAGVDTLEHVHASIYQDVAHPEDRHTREGGNGARPDYWSWLSNGWGRADLDADHVKRLIDQIAQSGVAISPTTVLCTGGMATLDALEEPGQVHRPRVMADRIRAARAGGAGEGPRLRVDPDCGRRALEHQVEFLRRVHAAGGRLAPGTDVGAAPLQVPGFALHRELALLVEGGIPSADVLQAATRGAAELLRAGAELGTIEPGKRADLLVLSGDPLQDIHATRRIAAVVQAGRIHDPAAVLARIET
jgi:imidazolonepropionase-like amidohydrolase